MTSLSLAHKSNFRYLPVMKEQQQLGLYLTDCGYTVIEPGTVYPPRGHPDAYASNWEKGRTLDEYQVVYITQGGGTSRHGSQANIASRLATCLCSSREYGTGTPLT
jgi:hypothetical protein